jgi:hypothetical protein
MRQRVWLVCGPTEILTCRLIHEQIGSEEPTEDILVHYGRTISIPPHLREQTLSHGQSSDIWDRVVDLCDESEAISRMNESQERQAVELIWRHLGTDVSTIITHTIDLCFERLLLRAYPAASIILYDNGLASHTDKAVTAKSPQWNSTGSVSRADLARVSQAFFTFRDMLPIPQYLSAHDVRTFSRDNVLRMLNRMRSDFPHPQLGLPDAVRVHLVLGTAFYRTKRISYNDERHIYQRYIDGVLRDEHAVVLFKEHPRASDAPFFQSSERLHVLDTVLPVELVPLFTRVESAASISSTALLYLSWLFGVTARLLSATPEVTEKLPHVRLLHQTILASTT